MREREKYQINLHKFECHNWFTDNKDSLAFKEFLLTGILLTSLDPFSLYKVRPAMVLTQLLSFFQFMQSKLKGAESLFPWLAEERSVRSG